MYKRLINDFVKTELKKGHSIKKVKKYLLKQGYKEDDINEIMRGYEIRERDIAIKDQKVETSGALVKALSILLVVLIVGNIILFYVTDRFGQGTPTAAVVADEDYLKEVCEEYIREGKINVSEYIEVEGEV